MDKYRFASIPIAKYPILQIAQSIFDSLLGYVHALTRGKAVEWPKLNEARIKGAYVILWKSVAILSWVTRNNEESLLARNAPGQDTKD